MPSIQLGLGSGLETDPVRDLTSDATWVPSGIEGHFFKLYGSISTFSEKTSLPKMNLGCESRVSLE